MAGVPNDNGHRDGPGPLRTAQRNLIRFTGNADGATAIEYTFVVAMVALGLVAAMRAYSDKMVIVYNTLATAITPP